MYNPPKSVLVIGASGRLGLVIIRMLADHAPKPQVHAFCRDPSKLSSKDRALCTSVIQGNARRQVDIESALDKTQADFVIITVGNGNNKGKANIRAVSAQAMADAMKKPEYNHVHTVVVSSNGAGGSRMIVGFGIGKLVEFSLRHVLKDHTEQEAAFATLKERTDIVRPVSLTDNKATGNIQEFGDKDKCPNTQCDRKDVAKWIVEDMYGSNFGGKAVNIASKQ